MALKRGLERFWSTMSADGPAHLDHFWMYTDTPKRSALTANNDAGSAAA
jgi:hypothetical protein